MLGRKFSIYTDHRSQRNLITKVKQAPKQQKFMYKLCSFEFDIMYKPGKQNVAADSLSMLDEDQEGVNSSNLMSLSIGEVTL